jgi:hypothetical protein
MVSFLPELEGSCEEMASLLVFLALSIVFNFG